MRYIQKLTRTASELLSKYGNVSLIELQNKDNNNDNSNPLQTQIILPNLNQFQKEINEKKRKKKKNPQIHYNNIVVH